MRLLLDTHTLLWFYLDDPQLSRTAKTSILDPNNVVVVSPANYWEITIKVSIGKYVLKESYDEFIQHAIVDNGFTILSVEPRHTSVLTSLPFHHRDPFDRLLIGQAMVDGLTLVSSDKKMDPYPISRLW